MKLEFNIKAEKNNPAGLDIRKAEIVTAVTENFSDIAVYIRNSEKPAYINLRTLEDNFSAADTADNNKIQAFVNIINPDYNRIAYDCYKCSCLVEDIIHVLNDEYNTELDCSDFDENTISEIESTVKENCNDFDSNISHWENIRNLIERLNPETKEAIEYLYNSLS